MPHSHTHNQNQPVSFYLSCMHIYQFYILAHEYTGYEATVCTLATSLSMSTTSTVPNNKTHLS